MTTGKTLRHIIEKVLRESTLRTYMKDWDDNILYMPTKIKMDKKIDGQWEPVDVSTSDFANVRNDDNYRTRNNDKVEAFSDFVESAPFIRDVRIAIKNKKFAPSAKKFKEALINANPFAINTARGHKPEILKKGVEIFIDMVFSPDEKEKMIKNIINSFKKEKRFSDYFETKLEDFSERQLIDLYLDEKGEYYSVSSKEFGKRFGVDVSGATANPEHSKKMAIADFVKKIWEEIKYWVNSGYSSISFGFSDDDKKNVMAAVEFLKHELSIQYPEIHFVVYDTSDGEENKIVITKKNKKT